MIAAPQFWMPDPQGETPVTCFESSRWSCRCVYARAAETAQAGEPGQDVLAMIQDDERLAFALCDGVGQSFFGELAAGCVKDVLLHWLWCLEAPFDQGALAASLQRDLVEAVLQVGNLVAAHALPDGLPEMTRAVLEKKRRLGSESMLAGGLFDTRSRAFLLAWMGDARLRLWDAAREQTSRLGENFLTRERWSSRRGPVGQAHAYAGCLDDLRAVVAYSDGFAILDAQSSPADLPDETIDGLARSQGGDDISYFEICPAANWSRTGRQ